MVAMVADSATIQLLIQLQEEIGVLLYSGEEDQLIKPFHWLPEFNGSKICYRCYHSTNGSMVATVARPPKAWLLEFEWTVAKSATVATIQRMVAR